MAANESLREVERWLNAGLAEAERWLPGLIGLPGPRMLRELETRPELRSVGMMRRLLEVAHDALDRYPQRAHELTAVVLQSLRWADIPAIDVTFLRRLEGQAWLEHGRALEAIGRTEDARAAIAMARELFEWDPGSGWHVATADLVEAPILHDLQLRDEALELVRAAAKQFALHRDHERHVDAVILEVWMLWTSGNRGAATSVLRAIEETARQRGDRTLTARVAGRMALFELRHGSAEKASDLFTSVLAIFDDTGLRPEAIRARWSLAEAAAARGRVHEAISEFYKVHAELLATGALIDAALAAAEILGLLLAAGREGEAARFADTLVFTFRDAGMSIQPLGAFTYLGALAARGWLGHEHVTAVRRYFEDVRQQPNARFMPL